MLCYGLGSGFRVCELRWVCMYSRSHYSCHGVMQYKRALRHRHISRTQVAHKSHTSRTCNCTTLIRNSAKRQVRMQPDCLDLARDVGVLRGGEGRGGKGGRHLRAKRRERWEGCKSEYVRQADGADSSSLVSWAREGGTRGARRETLGASLKTVSEPETEFNAILRLSPSTGRTHPILKPTSTTTHAHNSNLTFLFILVCPCLLSSRWDPCQAINTTTHVYPQSER